MELSTLLSKMLVFVVLMLIGYVTAWAVTRLVRVDAANAPSYEILMGVGNSMFIALPIAGALYGEAKVKALHRFDVLVLPSAYEPWGLVVNEALEAGVPVIVSDRVGARKDLVEGERPTGLVVAVEEKGALLVCKKSEEQRIKQFVSEL